MSGKPYKLLIADDEYWSREKIIQMMDWNEYGIELLKPAENGEEVLERMNKEKVDILITDINMPFVNGVELVERLKEQYPEVITFVISGYDDFEFVKSTMKAGSINYLLKPVSKMDLIQAVSEALDILYMRNTKVKMEEEKQKELQLASSWLQDREFSRFIDKEDVSYAAGASMEMNLDITGYTLVLIKIHDMHDIPSEFHKDMHGFSYSLKNKIHDLLACDSDKIFNHISKPNEFIIITTKDNIALNKVSMKIMKELESLLNSPITIVLSDHSYTLESMHSAYVQDISMLMMRTYSRSSVLMIYSEVEKKLQEERIENIFESAQEKELLSFLEHGKRQYVKDLFAQVIGKNHKDHAKYSFLEVKQILKQMNNMILRFYGNETDARDMIDMENMSDYVEEFIERLNLEVLCEVEEDFIDSVMQMHVSDETDSMKSIIEQIRQYIDKNYAEELTLAGLGKKYGIEKTYLSKIFRQEIGKNLMPYIAEKRIQKGMQLIADGKLNLTEISYLVGYDDYTYFNRVFRKIVGVSPTEYKNTCRKEAVYEKV